jgi:hypothetical protein
MAIGLALLWNDVFNVDIIQSNKMLIDMYITASNLNVSWYATSIYGYLYYFLKHLTCVAIKDLYQNRTSSKWLFFGTLIFFLIVLKI